MRRRVHLGSHVVFFAALCIGSSVMADTTTYTGNGEMTADETLMPLAYGDSVVTVHGQGLAAISTEPPTIMSINCTAMGLMRGNETDLTYYCSFTDTHSTADAFDVKGTETTSGGTTVEVLGGSGRWADAIGTGTVTQTAVHATGSRFSFEFSITTP